MRRVIVRVAAADFAREMGAMRRWIDSNQYEPTRFKYDQDEDAARSTSRLMLRHRHSRAGLSVDLRRRHLRRLLGVARVGPPSRPRAQPST